MTRATRQHPLQRRRQRGVVLFVSIIIVLMLTLFAIATADTALKENRMAGAARDQQLATLAADSALNEAKARIVAAAAAYGAAQVCAHLRCFIRAPGAPYDAAELMQTDEASAAMNTFRLDLANLKGIDATARLAAQPIYLIEDLGDADASPGRPPPAGAVTNRLFRITARGTGGRNEHAQVVESIYGVAR